MIRILALIVAIATPAFARSEFLVANRLRPFTSDGCSRFPDGIPLLRPTQWQLCCVVHDLAYWKGGTHEQRLEADRSLRSCVGEAVGNGLGQAMFLGVRLGGYVGLPFTWHWGYGWIQNRGYQRLTSSELQQVAVHMDLLPQLNQVPIESQSVFIPERLMLSGNYCVDEAAKYLAVHFDDAVRIVGIEESEVMNSDGYEKTLTVQIDRCSNPYTFRFQLLRASACSQNTNEVLARGRVRLQQVIEPEACD